MKLSLILNVIDPKIGGVMIMGEYVLLFYLILLSHMELK